MRKKATLLESEGLKLFLAVIVIFFLVLLAYQLYSIFIVKSDLEKARATLDAIVGKIQILQKEGKEEDIDKYLVTAPGKWYLVYYDKEIIEADKNKGMPSTCKGENCLCMCPAKRGVRVEIAGPPLRGFDKGGWPDYFYYSESYKVYWNHLEGLDMCEKEGVCINREDISIQNIEQYRKWTLLILQEELEGSVNWISFYELPKVIHFKKEKDKISISE